MEQLDAKIEGILFAMGEPVERSALAMALEITEKEVEVRMEALMETYRKENRGIQIIRLENSYQMCTSVSPAMTRSSGLQHDQESRC